MTKASIALTFPDCVNRGEGPCEAWQGMAEQLQLCRAQHTAFVEEIAAGVAAVQATVMPQSAAIKALLKIIQRRCEEELQDCRGDFPGAGECTQ